MSNWGKTEVLSSAFGRNTNEDSLETAVWSGPFLTLMVQLSPHKGGGIYSRTPSADSPESCVHCPFLHAHTCDKV